MPSADAPSSGPARRLAASDIPGWVEARLLSPDRTLPVVAVTSHPRTDQAWVDPDELAIELEGRAEVVFLRTGDATWALTEALPPRLDVYGGALRIWWPGLTPSANPYDHRLYIIRSEADAPAARYNVLAAIQRNGSAPSPSSSRATDADDRRPADHDRPSSTDAPPALSPEIPCTVRVENVSPGRIEVADGDRRGTVVAADLPLGILSESLRSDMQIVARPLRPHGDGTWDWSLEGLHPNPWQQLAAGAREGDTLLCRIQTLRPEKKVVFVDILPGVVGICHISELDYTFVADMSEFVQPGELLPFCIKSLDPEAMRAELSRKQALTQEARPSPPLFDGGPPFVWRSEMPFFENLRRNRQDPENVTIRSFGRAAAPVGEPEVRPSELEELKLEIEAAATERSNLVDQIRQLRTQQQSERKMRKAAEDRLRTLENQVGNENALASERAFLQAVRVTYARMFDEDDRLESPLRRMRVGRSFLESVQDTEGVEIDKLLEVCAQVAANLAHKVPGREAHPLRAGSRGAKNHVRERDEAAAWRCAIEIKTPSARRLHWWQIPGPDGATIEFASVGVHDSYAIPEN